MTINQLEDWHYLSVQEIFKVISMLCSILKIISILLCTKEWIITIDDSWLYWYKFRNYTYKCAVVNIKLNLSIIFQFWTSDNHKIIVHYNEHKIYIKWLDFFYHRKCELFFLNKKLFLLKLSIIEHLLNYYFKQNCATESFELTVVWFFFKQLWCEIVTIYCLLNTIIKFVESRWLI